MSQASKSMTRFPPILVAFEVRDPSGLLVHSGTFKLWDDNERRAFAERCNQAIADGYEVRTRRATGMEGNAAQLRALHGVIQSPEYAA